MQFKQILFFCVEFLVVVSGLKGGDICILEDKSTGVCKLYSTCIGNLKSLGQGATFCGYTTDEALICCPDNQVSEISRKSSVRVSVEKCNEYKQIEKAKCDYRVKARKLPPRRLIVGGEPTNSGEFPHMAALGWRTDDIREYDFICGGSLISENYVLTAAHCATNDVNIAPAVVRLGAHNLFLNDGGSLTIDIENFIRHYQYKPIITKYNDIALVKLKQSVSFNKFIRPACLWQTQHINESRAVATGFGLTAALGDLSDELLKVTLDIFDNNECQSAYKAVRKLPAGIVDSHICSGALEAGKDTCQGDSGGPLQILFIDKCEFNIIGVVAFGQDCGGTNSKAIYSRVSSYLDWIEGIVWK